MEKKEYLNIRFRRDLLRYSLLQEDSQSVAEIAGTLYGIIDFKRIFKDCMSEVEALNDKYLPSEMFVVDGKLSNVLGEGMGLEVQDKIFADFMEYLRARIPADFKDELLASIVHGIEKQAWKNGITKMALAVDALVSKLEEQAEYYRNKEVPCYDDASIKYLYDKAKETTLIERIKQNNIDDITEYRIALRQNVESRGEVAVNEALGDILAALASDVTFKRLKENFNALHESAVQMKSTLPETASVAEWDAEYNRAVPVDFYRRNVEGITAEQAFHMVLFMFFASKEEWLKENGMLVNGELKVFTCLNTISLENMLNIIDTEMIL